jgi:hypothetical protein
VSRRGAIVRARNYCRQPSFKTAPLKIENVNLQNQNTFITKKLPQNQLGEFTFPFDANFAGNELVFVLFSVNDPMNIIANQTFQLAPAVPRLRVSADPASSKKVRIDLSPALGETASTRVDSYNFWYFKENESSILRENTTISAKIPNTFTIVKPGSLYHYYAQAVVNGVSSESTTVDFRVPPLPVSDLGKNCLLRTPTQSNKFKSLMP